jgi:hypothetical protein
MIRDRDEIRQRLGLGAGLAAFGSLLGEFLCELLGGLLGNPRCELAAATLAGFFCRLRVVFSRLRRLGWCGCHYEIDDAA